MECFALAKTESIYATASKDAFNFSLSLPIKFVISFNKRSTSLLSAKFKEIISLLSSRVCSGSM